MVMIHLLHDDHGFTIGQVCVAAVASARLGSVPLTVGVSSARSCVPLSTPLVVAQLLRDVEARTFIVSLRIVGEAGGGAGLRLVALATSRRFWTLLISLQ